MDSNRLNNIAELVDKWLDGATSLDEERTLADYFAAGEVADELKWAAPLFARNAALRTATPAKPIAPKAVATPAPRLRTLRIALVTTLSAAAAMAVGLFGVNHTQKQSCAYINGQMVCDVEVVMESAAPVFARLSQSLQPINKTRATLSKVKSSTDRATTIIEKYNIEKLLQQ